MWKRTSDKQYDPLGESLRREALENRPAFSQALHERILRTLQTQRAEEPALVIRASAAAHRRYVRMAATAITAALLLLAVGVGWRWLAHPSLTERQPSQLAQAPTHEPTESDSATSGNPEMSDQADVSLVVDLAEIRQLAHQVEARLNLRDTLAMLDPSPQRLFYDDARRAANAILCSLPGNLTLPDDQEAIRQ